MADLFSLMAAIILAAGIWSMLLIRRIVRKRLKAYPDQSDYHRRVRSMALIGAGLSFFPALIAGTLMGAMVGALLMEPIALLTGHGFFGVDLGFALGTAIGTAILTGVGASLAVRLFAPSPC